MEARYRAAIANHQQGKLPAAVEGYRKILEEAPAHPGALYYLGAVHLEAGDAPGALALLKRAFSAEPNRGPDAHFALALAAHMSGERTLAATHYRAALNLDPQFNEARNNLAMVLRDLGQVDDAAKTLEGGAPQDRETASPDQLLNLANLRVDQGEYQEAESLYRQVLVARPNDFAALNNLGGLLSRVKRAEEALQLLDQAAAINPASADLWFNRARAHEHLLQLDEAVACYERSIQLDPGYFKSYTAWASLEEQRNRLDRAVELASQAVAIDADHPDNVGSRVVLSKYHRRQKQPAEALAELDAIRSSREIPLGARRQWLYERGTVLDALKRYDEAFEAFREANEASLEHLGLRYDQEQVDAHARKLMGFFTTARVKALSQLSPAPRAEFPQPLFVTGFPRSGTTLVEQILSAHPAITAGDELPYLTEIANQTSVALTNGRVGYPECLADLALARNHLKLTEFRDYYLGRARDKGLLQAGSKYFTDKMPLNEWRLGLVRLLFSDSPVIHVVRHPLDSCLSSFSIDLTHGNNCAYRLETVAHHYALTIRLTNHYRDVLGLRFLRIRYEDLVEDLEGGVRTLLDFVGVPFDERCLAFHESERVAHTASYAQVNQKLYTSSLYRYRHYRRHLESMLPILEPVIRELGYTIEE